MNIIIAISVLAVTAVLGEFRHRYQLALEDQHTQEAPHLKA